MQNANIICRQKFAAQCYKYNEHEIAKIQQAIKKQADNQIDGTPKKKHRIPLEILETGFAGV